MVTKAMINKAMKEQEKERKENIRFGLRTDCNNQIYQEWIDNAKMELEI